MTQPDITPDEQTLFEFLRERDVPCPLCAYNLRGLTTSRCPECGRELRLSVGLSEPFMLAWIALAFVIFATAGIGILVIWATILSNPFRLRDIYARVSLSYLIGSPLLAALIVVFRRQLLKLDKQSQWTLAITAMTLSLLMLIIFCRNL